MNNNKNKGNNQQGFNKQNPITAPYNFVPLNKEIFYPKWSNVFKEDRNGKKIHDFPVHNVPFGDGESGEIDIKIFTHSPIFIRDHHQDSAEYYTRKNDKDIKISKEFCYAKEEDGAKRFYIPASSIKGMIRNIVEIMSFSRIKIDEKEHKKTMGVRDMTNQKLLVGTASGLLRQTNIKNGDKKFYEDTNIGYGFLKIHQDGNGYLDDYGNPRTIDGREIKKAYSKYWFKEEDLFKKYKTIEPYSKIKVNLSTVDVCSKHGKVLGKKKIATYDSSGEEAIIFQNNYIKRKGHEFVLAKSDIKKRDIKIQDKVFKNFKSVYFSEGSEHTHKLGKFWKKESKSDTGKMYGIPVFYRRNKNGEINAIGLTQLFKLAYNQTIYDAARQYVQKDKIDLAETIFGTEKDKISLKGRIYFSHMKSNIVRYEKDDKVESKEEILGSPNPSYYPNYIEQTDLRDENLINYKTLMDSDATIRGYKRYPLQNQIQSHGLAENKDGKENKDIATKFKPLQKGVKFSGKLRFHNLKKEELGAILSALTFHGQNGKYFHNIGMAKPLGYGKIEIKLEYKKSLNYTQKEYLEAFENMMNAWDKKEFEKWRQSKQLKELFSMSDTSKAKKLRYQKLKNKESKYKDRKGNVIQNEFVGAKGEKQFLQPYSQYQ